MYVQQEVYSVFYAGKNYWGKDLVFLVTSQHEVGIQAWLNAYMGEQNSGKRPGKPKIVAEKKT